MLMAPGDMNSAPETDSGPRDRSGGPMRLCALTRTNRPISQMIRFVVGPDGTVVPDIKRRLPGRGVWVTATAEAVRQAASRNVFARSLRRAVQVPADLAALTDRLLEKSALDALAIAYKAGLAVCGFAKVEQILRGDGTVAVIHAADAAPDGVRKLESARRRSGEGEKAPVSVRIFTKAQLDLAFGRPNVIHAALLAGPESEAFLARLSGLIAFRGGGTADE